VEHAKKKKKKGFNYSQELMVFQKKLISFQDTVNVQHTLVRSHYGLLASDGDLLHSVQLCVHPWHTLFTEQKCRDLQYRTDRACEGISHRGMFFVN